MSAAGSARAGIELGAHLVGAELVEDGAGVIDERTFVADREDADLLGGKPERKVAGVMFDEEADKTFVGVWRASARPALGPSRHNPLSLGLTYLRSIRSEAR